MVSITMGVLDQFIALLGKNNIDADYLAKTTLLGGYVNDLILCRENQGGILGDK